MRVFSLVLAATILCGAALIAPVAAALAEEQPPAKRQLLVEGARLWPVYCAQCHNARPGSQFSPAQWDAITMHMKTLSNMPAKDMAAIREFLKEAR
jgi:mono/diheme cytochrome c family protein